VDIAITFLVAVFGLVAKKLFAPIRDAYFMRSVWSIALEMGSVDETAVNVSFDSISSDAILALKGGTEHLPWRSAPDGVIISPSEMKKSGNILQFLVNDKGTDPFAFFGFGPRSKFSWADTARFDLVRMPSMHVWKDTACLVIMNSDISYISEEESDGQAFLINANATEFMAEAYSGDNITGGGQVRLMLPVTEDLRRSKKQIIAKSLTVETTTSSKLAINKAIDKLGLRDQINELTAAGIRVIVFPEDTIKLKGTGLRKMKSKLYKKVCLSLINKPASNKKARSSSQDRAMWSKKSVTEMCGYLKAGALSLAANKCFGWFKDNDQEADDKIRLGHEDPVSRLAGASFAPSVIMGSEIESSDGSIRKLRNLWGDAVHSAINNLNKWDFSHIGLRTYAASLPETERHMGLLPIGLLKRMGSDIEMFDYILLSRSPSINPVGQPTLVRGDLPQDVDFTEYSYFEYIDQTEAGHVVPCYVYGIKCICVEGFMFALDNMVHIHPDMMKLPLQGDFDGDCVLCLGFVEYREPVFESYEAEMSKYDKNASDQQNTMLGLWANIERASESAMAIGVISAMFNMLLEMAQSGGLALDTKSAEMCRLGASVNAFVDMVKKKINHLHAFGRDLYSLNDVAILVWELSNPSKTFDGWKDEGGNARRPSRKGYQSMGIGNPKRLLDEDEFESLEKEDVNFAAAQAWVELSSKVCIGDAALNSHCHSEIIAEISKCEGVMYTPKLVDNDAMMAQVRIKAADLGSTYSAEELNVYINQIDEVQLACKEFAGSWVKEQANRMMSDKLNDLDSKFLRALTLQVMYLELNSKFKSKTLSMTLDLATQDFWGWFFHGYAEKPPVTELAAKALVPAIN